MAIFLDSGFFLGLLNRKDSFNLKSKKDFIELSTGKFGIIYTSILVISEAATLILIRTKNNQDIINQFWELTLNKKQFIHILYPTKKEILSSKEIYSNHNKTATDKRNYLSFVDASNIALCKSHFIEYIAATDGDFAPYMVII